MEPCKSEIDHKLLVPFTISSTLHTIYIEIHTKDSVFLKIEI